MNITQAQYNGLIQYLKCISNNTSGSQLDLEPVENLLGDILLELQNQPQEEIVETLYCDTVTGDVTGSIIKVWDEETDTFTEVYTDSNGAITTVRPLGSVCKTIDYEYKTFEYCFIDSNGDEVKHVVCLVFIDGVRQLPTSFWILPTGVVVTTEPTDLTPCKDECNSGLLYTDGDNVDNTFLFNELEIIKPACCIVEVSTSVGDIILEKSQISKTLGAFKCPILLVSVTILEGDCTLDQVKLTYQRF